MNKPIIVAVAALLLVAAPPAHASPPTTGTGTAVVTSSTVTDIRTADSNTFITVEFTEVHTGVQTGAFTGWATLAFHPDGSVTWHGVASCVCTIDGRTGTLVVQFEGSGPSFAEAEARSTVISADGNLEGLHGYATAVLGFYTFTYHFDRD